MEFTMKRRQFLQQANLGVAAAALAVTPSVAGIPSLKNNLAEVRSVYPKQVEAAGAIMLGITRAGYRPSRGTLEPHYDRFEYLLGTSGKTGNINMAE
jgi:hypothetical protein